MDIAIMDNGTPNTCVFVLNSMPDITLPANSTDLLDITNVTPQPEAGWTFDGTTWSPPAAESNEADLIAKATSALTNNETFLAIATPTAAQAIPQVQALTRQVDALIRLATGELDSTDGT